MSNVGWTSADAVDWNEVSTEPPPPLNPALYKGLIVKAEPSPTKENKPAIAIELQIDKEYGGPDVSPVRKMFDNLTLTKEAAFKVKQLAAAANVAPPANFGIDAVRAFCDSLVDAGPVILRSKLSEWQGKKNHKVDRYLSEEQAKLASAGGEQPSGTAEPQRRKRAAA
jgi:hypothetical protein